MWGFAAVYALGGLPLGFVLYYAPIHLGRVLGYGLGTLGHVLWVPPLGWEVGYFFWGWVIDRAAAAPRYGSILKLLAVMGFAFALAPLTRSLVLLLALMFGAMFVSAGCVIVSLAEVTDRHTTRHGAYLAGIGAGSWAALMAPAMPLFGKLFDVGHFGVAYVLASFCPAAGWLVWRKLSRN